MISLFSPAKLNLSFRVLKKRDDGYHEIASIFQAVSLGDYLNVELSNKDTFVCDDPTIPSDTSNLVIKALNLFRIKTGLDIKASIHLDKRVPIQAGLGGGSSNAATTFWALNELCGRPASLSELSAWSSEFSSDAPFFFSEGTAFCTGRGEILESLPPLPQTYLWIAKPNEGLSTPLVYKNCTPLSLPNRDPKISYFNDLEISAFSLMPKLADLKRNLMDLGFSSVIMTGSGTSFFCFGDVADPKLPDVKFFPVEFIQRKPGAWY